MKNTKQVNLRSTPEQVAQFHTACDQHGVKASAVIRDLCAASIPYMAEHCPPGRWIAPSLVPYGTGRHRSSVNEQRRTDRLLAAETRAEYVTKPRKK